MGTGLPRLLISGRSLRWLPRASKRARRRIFRHLSRHHARNHILQEPHGVALPVGLFQPERIQLRSPRFLHQGQEVQRQSPVQLRRTRIPQPGGPRTKRLLQKRRRRNLPYLFYLRPRPGHSSRRLQLPRHDSQRPRRRQPRAHHGLGSPPRPLRKRLTVDPNATDPAAKVATALVVLTTSSLSKHLWTRGSLPTAGKPSCRRQLGGRRLTAAALEVASSFLIELIGKSVDTPLRRFRCTLHAER